MSYLQDISSKSLVSFLSDLKTSPSPASLLQAVTRAHPALFRSIKERIFQSKDRELNGVVAGLEIASELLNFDAGLSEELRKTWFSSAGGFDFVPSVIYPVLHGKMDIHVAKLFRFMTAAAVDPEISSFLFRSVNWSLEAVSAVPSRRVARPDFSKFSLALLRSLPDRDISDLLKTRTLVPTALRLLAGESEIATLSAAWKETLEQRVVGNGQISRQAKQRLFDGFTVAALAQCPDMEGVVKAIVVQDLLRNVAAASEILKVAKFSQNPNLAFSLVPAIVQKFPTLLEQSVAVLPAVGLTLKYLSAANYLTLLFRSSGRVAGITKADLTKAIGNPDACALVKVTGLKLLLAVLKSENLEISVLPDVSFVFAQNGVSAEISDSQLVALSLWADCVATYKLKVPGSFKLLRADWSRKIREISDRTSCVLAKLVCGRLLATLVHGARLTPSLVEGVVWLFRLRRDLRKAKLDEAEVQLSAALQELLTSLPFLTATHAITLVAKVKREEQISDLHKTLCLIAADPLSLIDGCPDQTPNIFRLAVAAVKDNSLAKYSDHIPTEAEGLVEDESVGNGDQSDVQSEISRNFRSPIPTSIESERELLRDCADLRLFIDENLSTLIFSLASENAQVRREGSETLGWLLARLRTEMETEEKRFAFKEVPQVFWLLVVLRNSIKAPAETEAQPLLLLSFMAACLAVILRPDHVAYKTVYKFLTGCERVSCLRTLPLFSECMQSDSVEQAKLLRVWWLRFVARASECPRSAQLLLRHQMMEICMTLTVAESTDRVAASLAIAVVSGLVKASTSEKLIRRFGICDWLAHVASTSKHVLPADHF